MNRSTVLASLLGVLALLAIGVVWWLQADDPQLDARGGSQLATSAAARSALAAAETNAAVAPPAQRSEGNPVGAPSPPVPPNSQWITIRAIDRATKTAVAGATVHWVDDTSNAALDRTAGLDHVDRTVLRANTEAFAARFGWRTTTDAAGIARVSRNGWLTVTAATSRTYGDLYLDPDLLAPADGFVVELVPDHRIVVQVVDDRGDPVPDVSVGLYAGQVDDRATRPGPWAVKARTRAPDGTAILEHAQSARPPLETEFERTQDWRVFSMPSAPDDFGTAVSLDDPPREPIVLRLPTCGRVVLLPPREPGLPAIGLCDTSLRDSASGTALCLEPGLLQSDGSMLFPRIPIGREYFVNPTSPTLRDTTFAGPTTRDEEITVQLRLVTNKLLLAARILGDDGQPVRDAAIGFLIAGNRFHGNAWLRTDAAGRVLATWNEPGEGDRIERLVFFCSAPFVGHGELTPANLHPGFNELGDVRLSRDQLVCSGRFVRGDALPAADVAFEVEHLVPDDEPGGTPVWDVATALSIHQENGRFWVLGTPPDAELRLVFDGSQQLPHDPVPFRAGTRDLEIAIETAHSLSASVLVPKDAPEFPIVAELVPTLRPANVDANDARSSIERENHHADAAGTGERRNLHWSTLRRGTYTLELRSWFDAEPIVRIPDVVVPPLAPGDPRLEDIDLRGRLRLLHVRMLDATGELARNASGVVFLDGQAKGRSWRGFAYRDPEFALLAPKAPLELLFAGNQVPPRLLRADGERLDVQFLPWPTLDLVVADIPPLPDGIRVIASLDAQDRREIEVHEQGDTNSSAELNDVPGSYVRIVDGRASLPIGDGPHTLSLGLAHANGRIQFGLLEEELQVTATTPPPVVRISPERWEWAIRSLLDAAAKDAERRRSSR